MKSEMLLNLSNVQSIRDFSNDVSKFEEDVDAIRGNYVVDAKSIMGIFSLDLSVPVTVRIHSDDENRINKFREVMMKYSD